MKYLNDNMIIPKQVLIETVNGTCTANCTMCSIQSWTRKPNIMDDETFHVILKKLQPYQKNIKFLSLFGCGEPLLDQTLTEKISSAKKMGFHGIGFASNCTELNEEKSKSLIKSGLDTIICSIDGIKKETHELIRRGTDFDEVTVNVKNFIRIRNRYGRTKVIIRFIRQNINKREWEPFYEYWKKEINEEFGDKILKFNIHNWGDKVDEYSKKELELKSKTDNYFCKDLFEKLLIRSRGEIAFCDADDNLFFNLGNAVIDDPVLIYNGSKFNEYRKAMLEGKILELDHCKHCSIPRSLLTKEK